MSSSPLLRTALYEAHVAAGAKLVPFAGYEMPVRYDGDTAEHLRVRQDAGLFDVSHMGEFLVAGPQALHFLNYITSNDISKITVGKAQYNCLPTEEAGIVDDIIVYRLEEELYLVVVNASNIEKDWNWFTQHNSQFGATLTNLSDSTSLLALSGPRSLGILKHICPSPIEDLPYYGVSRAQITGLDTDRILIATTGYTGERTYEIFVPNEHAATLWQLLLEAGAADGLKPAGLGARDTLRLEMGYMLYGNDISDSVSALEAGLGWIVKLDQGNFVGRTPLARQRAEGIKRKLVAFRTDDPRAIPRQHCLVYRNGEPIGEVTSGGFSPCLKCGIGLALVSHTQAVPGETLDIEIRGQHKSATIVKPPFVSPTSLTGWK
jgi:aminomethyltransferase